MNRNLTGVLAVVCFLAVSCCIIVSAVFATISI